MDRGSDFYTIEVQLDKTKKYHTRSKLPLWYF
jgi:hypothetical protein